MRKLIVFGVVAALSLGAAACGDDDDNGGSAATSPATSAPQPQATTPASGRSAVVMRAVDFRFNPANPTVKAGQTTFTLTNAGQAPHALEVEGKGIEKETNVITPGQTARLQVNLKPGTYEFYCPVGNHRQMGMEGKITVQ